MAAIFKRIRSFKYVTYYTVQYEESAVSEFTKFLQKFGEDERTRMAFQKIVAAMQHFGNDYYASLEDFFVNEREAERFRETGQQFISSGYGLRLYCYPITRSLVVVFNGCEKTSTTAQDCPNCGMPFYQANSLSRKIKQALTDGFISISRNGLELEIDEDFLLDT